MQGDEEGIGATRIVVVGQHDDALRVGRITHRLEALGAATPVSVHNTISEVYPLPENLVLVLVGDAAAIRDDIERYGPVTEMSITEPRFRPDQ